MTYKGPLTINIPPSAPGELPGSIDVFVEVWERDAPGASGGIRQWGAKYRAAIADEHALRQMALTGTAYSMRLDDCLDEVTAIVRTPVVAGDRLHGELHGTGPSPSSFDL